MKLNFERKSLYSGFATPVEQLKDKMCLPYSCYLEDKITVSRESGVLDMTFKPSFDLNELLYDTTWIDKDITRLYLEQRKSLNNNLESDLGSAFSNKYGNMAIESDARSSISNWSTELNRALSHISYKNLRGAILHLGSDDYYEPEPLHSIARSVTLVDVSKSQLDKAGMASGKKKMVLSPAENLLAISNASIDLYVALRVYCAAKFNYKSAIEQASKKLKRNGSILLSISNGYKAFDNTILNGQISGTPYTLNLTKPFELVKAIIKQLHQNGFRELFVVPGSCEIFLGGSYFQGQVNYGKNHPIVHTESPNDIPICFYSERMPVGWLGNFSNHSIMAEGFCWKTAEHYFQSLKFKDIYLKESIRDCNTPLLAKNFAWKHSDQVIADWNTFRLDAMRSCLKLKFDQHPELKNILKKTGKRQIIERSADDHFWGQALDGTGRNMLGNLLTAIRDN